METIVLNNSSRNSKSNRRQNGSALVEFALVLVVLFTMMFGIIDFSRCIYAYHWTAEAAREASRWASVRGEDCTTWTSACPNAVNTDVTAYVQTVVSSGIYVSSTVTGSPANTAGALGVTTTWPGTAGNGGTCFTSPQTSKNPGCVVKVQVQYVYGFTLPYLTSLSKITMTSTSQVVISQ